ncbi:MAG: hypothetical protein JNK76_13130 [Planctomycetales bacterium]|nr:hypothetical protein [Planctomycetales bacterium]MBN8625156.1 hypothetical protein [Planctomycetota bacterium]
MKLLSWAGLLVVAVEAIVRVVELGSGATLSDSQRLTVAKLQPGVWLRGRYVNSWGYWDQEFQVGAAPSGIRRVALLGDSSLLAGGPNSNVASMLEDTLANTEVDHFAVVEGGPREFVAQFHADVIRRNPQQLIVCLAMAPPAIDQPQSAGLSQWHTLHFLQAIVGPNTAHAEGDPFNVDRTQAVDYDEFVRRRASTIDASRSDIDDSELRSAQNSIAQLAQMCERQRIPLKLVLIPGEYQLSTQLTTSFARRREIDATSLDLELPQRRWRAFGEHLGVEVVDLLPTMKASREIVYRTNSPEWNERGIALAAETIARGL